MAHLFVLPRCSAAVEEGRCHFMKLVPDTNGTLFRSMMRSCKSKRARRDFETKALDMPVRPDGVLAPLPGGVSEEGTGRLEDAFWRLLEDLERDGMGLSR